MIVIPKIKMVGNYYYYYY